LNKKSDKLFMRIGTIFMTLLATTGTATGLPVHKRGYDGQVTQTVATRGAVCQTIQGSVYFPDSFLTTEQEIRNKVESVSQGPLIPGPAPCDTVAFNNAKRLLAANPKTAQVKISDMTTIPIAAEKVAALNLIEQEDLNGCKKVAGQATLTTGGKQNVNLSLGNCGGSPIKRSETLKNQVKSVANETIAFINRRLKRAPLRLAPH
jgi:hypothetical protein